MQGAPTVVLLYDTLDSLVALKLDLMQDKGAQAPLATERRRRMCADIDHSIDNIRGVINVLEANGSRVLPARAGSV